MDAQPTFLLLSTNIQNCDPLVTAREQARSACCCVFRNAEVKTAPRGSGSLPRPRSFHFSCKLAHTAGRISLRKYRVKPLCALLAALFAASQAHGGRDLRKVGRVARKQQDVLPTALTLRFSTLHPADECNFWTNGCVCACTRARIPITILTETTLLPSPKKLRLGATNAASTAVAS